MLSDTCTAQNRLRCSAGERSTHAVQCSRLAPQAEILQREKMRFRMTLQEFQDALYAVQGGREKWLRSAKSNHIKQRYPGLLP